MWEALLELIASFCIFTIVNPDESGVHLRNGRVHRVIGEGFHWQYPIVDEIQTIPNAQQAIDLPNQTLTTKDGITVNLSGTVRYEVVCPEKTLFTVVDYDDTLQTLAMEIIGEEVPKHTFSPSSAILARKIHERLETVAYQWGIDIIQVGITDKAKTRAIRLWN